MKTQSKIWISLLLILILGGGMTQCCTDENGEVKELNSTCDGSEIFYRSLRSKADSATDLSNSDQYIFSTDVKFSIVDPIIGSEADTSGPLEITFLESLVEVVVCPNPVLKEEIDSLRYTWLAINGETQLNVGKYFPIFPFYPDSLQPETGPVTLPGNGSAGDTLQLPVKYDPLMQNQDQVVVGGLAVIVITIDPADAIELRVLKVEYLLKDGIGWRHMPFETANGV